MVICGVIKHTFGHFRPYFADLCPQICSNPSPLDGYHSSLFELNITNDDQLIIFCSNEKFNTSIEKANHLTRIRGAKLSFPSTTAALIFYFSLFLILYLNTTLTKHWIKFIASLISSILFLIALIVANDKLITTENHIEDVLFGSLFGILIAIYIYVIYANYFAVDDGDGKEDNQGLKYDAWFSKYLQIPRATLSRLSRRSKKKPETMSTRGIINPVFRKSSDDIKRARMSIESRFYN